jgi:putative Holliday junction resolvase
MRVLALDIGEKRVGCAFGETEHAVAVPLKVLSAADVEGLGKPFLQLLEDYEPDLLLSGLPLTMAGEHGKQAERVERIARKVSESTGIELAFVDERLSSAQAKRIMHEQGLTEKQMRGKLDSVAASLFLQSWLEGYDRSPSEDAWL